MRWNEGLSLDVLSVRPNLLALLETNRSAAAHGLQLTMDDAEEIVSARNRLLGELGRVEFGAETMRELAIVFSASSFITQEDYAATLIELLELFHWLKNETDDQLSDHDLILAMYRLFEHECAGSVSKLRDCQPAEYARAVRQLRPRGLCWEEGFPRD